MNAECERREERGGRKPGIISGNNQLLQNHLLIPRVIHTFIDQYDKLLFQILLNNPASDLDSELCQMHDISK